MPASSTRKSAVLNLAASVAPMLVAFLTLPFLIHRIGSDRFGIITIFGILLGSFGLFDFGMGRAIAHRFAVLGEERLHDRRTVFGTALAINVGCSVAGMLLMIPVSHWYFSTQLKIPQGFGSEAAVAAAWLPLTLPIALLTSVLRGALQGDGRFAELNLITVAGNIVSQALMIGTAYLVSPTLLWIAPVLFASRALIMLALLYALARRTLHGMALSLDRHEAKSLFAYGGWVTVSGLLAPFINAIDRMLVGSTLGATAVSFYSVPYQLGERTVIVPLSISDALFPKIAASDEGQARELAVRSISLVSAIMSLMMACGIFVLHPFLAIYVSPAFAEQAAAPGRILLAGWALNCYGICCLTCLQAGGRPRLVALAHLVEVVPFIALLLLLMHEFGLQGAAAAFALRIGVDSLLLARLGGIFRQTVTLAAWPTIGLATVFIATLFQESHPLLSAALALAGIAGLTVLANERAKRENISPLRVISSLRKARTGPASS